MDIVESSLLQAEVEQFGSGLFRGGSGPDDQTRKARDEVNENEKVRDYTAEFSQMKDGENTFWSEYRSRNAFKVDPGCSHRPDKRHNSSSTSKPAKRQKTADNERTGRKRTVRSKEFLESLRKAKSEPFLIELCESASPRIEPGEIFHAKSINSDTSPSCTCPYFLMKKKNRQQVCKHMLWVLVKVLNQQHESYLLQQTSFTRSEVDAIFKEAPALIPLHLRKERNKTNQDSSSILTALEDEAIFKVQNHCYKYGK